MLDAGVSKDVIRTYVEMTPGWTLTPEDLITLKQRSVPDDITTALLKHRPELRQPQVPSSVTSEIPAAPAGFGVRAPNYQHATRLDPEGYDFWWYHYAYPRALSAANERLYPYSPLSRAPLYYTGPFGPRFGYPGGGFP